MTEALACLGVLLLGAGVLVRSRQRAVPLPHPGRAEYIRSLAGIDGDAEALWASVEGLRADSPDEAFDKTLSLRQQEALIVAGTVLVALMVLSWNLTLVALVGAVILFYFGSLIVRLILFVKALNGSGRVSITDEMARAVAAASLPTYTVLVPAYREPEVMHRLIPNLLAIDYPKDKLEILLLLEADDDATRRVAEEVIAGDPSFQVVLVPPIGPRTKPKALNYGLHKARGSLVTIYDAEDRPEPLQLRKAALALAAAPPNVACVQARLDFFNPTQNMITKWFTLDYRMWFTQLLPGLVQMGAPIPLGGTSNHFYRQTLIDIGAWDSFNVTEDADLGVRLHRRGYRTGVIDSTTYEEANSDFVNWIKQRSRWYKGYVQTTLVHLRRPVSLWRDLGPKGFVLFMLFVAGTPLLAALNPVFWTVTIVWFVWHPPVIQHVIPTFTYVIGQFSWIAGNALVLYSWLLSARDPKEKLSSAALLAPAYWVMMALAATKAVVQLATAPSYWEKTSHGLDIQAAPAARPAQAPAA